MLVRPRPPLRLIKQGSGFCRHNVKGRHVWHSRGLVLDAPLDSWGLVAFGEYLQIQLFFSFLFSSSSFGRQPLKLKSFSHRERTRNNQQNKGSTIRQCKELRDKEWMQESQIKLLKEGKCKSMFKFIPFQPGET